MKKFIFSICVLFALTLAFLDFARAGDLFDELIQASNQTLCTQLQTKYPDDNMRKLFQQYRSNKTVPPTANKKGNEVNYPNYLTSEYLQFLKSRKKKPLTLDVGGAWGTNALNIVQQTQANIIVNDIAEVHLAAFHRRLQERNQLGRVQLIARPFPKYDLPTNTLDAVVLSHVLHYIPGAEIESGFKKIKEWLKPDGKVFVRVLTPYSRPFYDYADSIRAKHAKGKTWPGEIDDIKDRNASAKPKIIPPKGSVIKGFVNPILPDDLLTAVTSSDLKVTYCQYAGIAQDTRSKKTLEKQEQDIARYFSEDYKKTLSEQLDSIEEQIEEVYSANDNATDLTDKQETELRKLEQQKYNLTHQLNGYLEDFEVIDLIAEKQGGK